MVARELRRDVTDPSGAAWRVQRTWVRGRWQRYEGRLRAAWSRSGQDLFSGGDFLGQVSGDSAEAVILAIVAVVLALFVLVPILLFGIELIIVGAAIAIGMLGRLFLGQPWVVAAECLDSPGTGRAWRVSGMRRSQRVLDQVARALEAGDPPEPAETAEAIALPSRSTA